MGQFLKTAAASVVVAATLASTASVAAAGDHKPDTSTMTIAGIVAASGGEFDHNGRDYDLLLNAVKAAGLVGALDDPGADVTVFAPDDRAFVRLARNLGYEGRDEAGAFDAIVAVLTKLGNGDPVPLLTQVLLYHVVAGSVSAQQLRGLDEVTTLQGGTVQVSFPYLIDADPDLRDPRISRPFNLRASNGTVHTINRVLIPTDL